MNLVRRSRMATPRRWLQFSLRGFLVVLTIGCLWLGWKVERAHKRGRAIDAIVAAGGRVYYFDNANQTTIRVTPQLGHVWADLKESPIGITLPVPLVAVLDSHLSQLIGIRHVTLLPNRGVNEALERLRTKLPNTTIGALIPAVAPRSER